MDHGDHDHGAFTRFRCPSIYHGAFIDFSWFTSLPEPQHFQPSVRARSTESVSSCHRTSLAQRWPCWASSLASAKSGAMGILWEDHRMMTGGTPMAMETPSHHPMGMFSHDGISSMGQRGYTYFWMLSYGWYSHHGMTKITTAGSFFHTFKDIVYKMNVKTLSNIEVMNI